MTDRENANRRIHALVKPGACKHPVLRGSPPGNYMCSNCDGEFNEDNWHELDPPDYFSPELPDSIRVATARAALEWKITNDKPPHSGHFIACLVDDDGALYMSGVIEYSYLDHYRKWPLNAMGYFEIPRFSVKNFTRAD